MREQLQRLKEWIEESNRIVFFGGAGVSTESGIPDFRSETGIYKTMTKYGRSPEDIISRSFFCDDPELFYRFYKETMIAQDAEPNPAHRALVRLEQRGKLKAVITQNIDGLHQKAGSRTVYELHGTVYRNYCMDCMKRFSLDEVMKAPGVLRCNKCGGLVKPDVVLYEESLDQLTMRNSIFAIEDADMLIVGGTSLNVYPAAGMIEYYRGAKLVLINRDPTPYDGCANLLIQGNIGEILGECILK